MTCNLPHCRCKAETCGMNLRRKADLAAIKAESQLPEPEFLAIIGPSDGEGLAGGAASLLAHRAQMKAAFPGAEIEANEAPLADIDRCPFALKVSCGSA